MHGHRLVFDLPVGPGERAVANIRPDPLECVHGVAWEITSRDARHLDRTEGVHRGYYKRIGVELRTPEGETLEAFTYASPHGSDGRKPSARYMGLLLRGARHHGLPGPYVEWLESLELAVDERQSQARRGRRPG